MGLGSYTQLCHRACRAVLFTLHAAWAGWATRLAGPLQARTGSTCGGQPEHRPPPGLARPPQRGLRHHSASSSGPGIAKTPHAAGVLHAGAQAAHRQTARQPPGPQRPARGGPDHHQAHRSC